MKIFHTTSNDVISECQLFFRFPPVHILVRERKLKFLQKYAASENVLCNCFSIVANDQLNELKSLEL